ncbi:CorA family divalent cation transporter [Streptomyces sp. NPDC005209]|uniref:magnesium transporter CorA family protein n=1 Tax=Streptomyces sp. NPDC005209 TaxID=3156715 RepID=UPI0033A0EFD1
MIVSLVSMPEGITTRADLTQARERLAESDFLLVDIQLPEEEPADEGIGPEEAIAEDPRIAQQLGVGAYNLPWFGRAGEAARADFLGDAAGFVVPVVEDSRVTHVHVLVTERFVITVHWGQIAMLGTFAARLVPERPPDPVAAMFLLLQEALETFRRAALACLLAVEDLEDEMFERRRPEQVYNLARLRRRSALLHHSLLPYLQATDELVTRRMMSRNFPEERQRLAREFQNASRLVLADIESLQDASRRALSSYSSLVSGEQNNVINRLAIVSTIFLPLSFLTGYFGMNFTYLTDELESKIVFWMLAVGLQVAVLVAALYVLHRMHLWRKLRDDEGTDDR